MIQSDWLHSFIAFAETSSFTQAARGLHLSQPALHVQIRKLSEELGVALYIRNGRSLALTEAGRRVLAFAREERERAERLRADITGVARPTSVTLATGEGTLFYLLSGALRTFQQGKHGSLRVLTRDSGGAVAAVQLGEAQLAVTVLDEAPSGLVARKLARVGAAAILSKSHALARKRHLSVRDLRDEPIIAPGPGRPLRAALARAWAEQGLSWSPAVEANGWELMMRLAALGLGVAVVNDFCTPPPGTVRRPLVGLPTVQYQLVRARDRPSNAAAEALERAILSTARA